MRALLVTGVLGIGTALVFAAAALTASLFPNGTVVRAGWNGGMWVGDGWGGPVAMPAPAVIEGPGFMVEDQFQPLPGDTVGGDPGVVWVTPEPVP